MNKYQLEAAVLIKYCIIEVKEVIRDLVSDFNQCKQSSQFVNFTLPYVPLSSDPILIGSLLCSYYIYIYKHTLVNLRLCPAQFFQHVIWLRTVFWICLIANIFFPLPYHPSLQHPCIAAINYLLPFLLSAVVRLISFLTRWTVPIFSKCCVGLT